MHEIEIYEHDIFLCFVFLISPYMSLSRCFEFDIDAKSAILMEASSGRVIYEKIRDKLPPASITKYDDAFGDGSN